MAAKQSVEAYTTRETRLGLLPMTTGQRLYSMWDLICVAGAYAIATWCYVQGAYVAGIVSMPQAIGSVFGGIMAPIVMVALVGVIANRYGTDHWLCFRTSVGFRGVWPLLIVMVFAGLGWYAINADLYAGSLAQLLDRAGWPTALENSWVYRAIAITCPIIGWLIALKGPGAVRIATRIMFIALAAVGIMMVIIILVSGNLGQMWNELPLWGGGEADRTTYMLSVEWNLAFAFSWAPAIGQLTRLTKTGRGSFWGLWWSYGFVMCVYIFIGLAVGYAAVAKGSEATEDPTVFLISVGGPALGSIALILVGIANISTAAVGTYAMGMTTKILWPTWPYRWTATAVALWVVILTAWGGIFEYYGTFLAVVGSTNGGMLALMIVDYYVLRRNRLDLNGLFESGGSYRYTWGANIPGLLAYAAGILAYFLIYNPIDAVVRTPAVFNIFTASGFCAVVTAAAYLLFAALPSVRRYLLNDREVAC